MQKRPNVSHEAEPAMAVAVSYLNLDDRQAPLRRGTGFVPETLGAKVFSRVFAVPRNANERYESCFCDA